jgi:DNA-binding transcriptional ArsR family regulator
MITEKTSARLEMRASILKALAHPTRLFIVEKLADGERCVCELQEMIGADMSTVSKHLSVLKGVGLIGDDKRGNQVFYTLKAPCILNVFDCVEQAVRRDLKERTACLR